MIAGLCFEAELHLMLVQKSCPVLELNFWFRFHCVPSILVLPAIKVRGDDPPLFRLN